jgi:hypothetical protein
LGYQLSETSLDNRPILQLTNNNTMLKPESDSKQAAAVDDDEPDEWYDLQSQTSCSTR